MGVDQMGVDQIVSRRNESRPVGKTPFIDVKKYEPHTLYSSSNPLSLSLCICTTCSPNFETGIGFL